MASSLRFKVGDLVLCKVDNVFWCRGIVRKQWARAADWPPDHPPAAYEIESVYRIPQSANQGRLVYIEADTDCLIRARPIDKIPTTKTFDHPPGTAAKYGFVGPEDGDIMEILNKNNREGNAEFGLSASDLSMIGLLVSFTRIPVVIDESLYFPSFPVCARLIVPPKTSFVELVAAARSSSEKMLQVADGFMYGFHGWEKSRVAALMCYFAAAWGCPMDEVEEHEKNLDVAVPMGPPEACAQAGFWMMMRAVQLLYTTAIEDDVWQAYQHEVLDALNAPSENVKSGTVEEFLHLIRGMLVFWDASIRGGLVTTMMDHIGSLLFSDKYRAAAARLESRELKMLQAAVEAKNQYWELHKLKRDTRKIDEDSNYSRMSALVRSSEVGAQRYFLSLPLKSTLSFSQARSDFHIEFREEVFAAFLTKTVSVYVVVPSIRKTVEYMRLPDHFVMLPFTQASFSHVWTTLLSNISNGKAPVENELVYRPTVITTLNASGTRSLAEYLKRQVGQNSGTVVKLVEEFDHVPGSLFNDTYKSAVDECQKEDSFVDKFSVMEDEERKQYGAKTSITTQLWNKRARQHVNGEELFNKAKTLKERGNAFFQNQRLSPARKCYSDAIEMLRVFELSDAMYQLVVVLLSNRALTLTKMANEITDKEVAGKLLQTAIEDCQVVIANPGMSNLSPSFLSKVKYRLKNVLKMKYELATREAGEFLEEEMARQSAKELLARVEESDIQHVEQHPTRRRRRRRRRSGRQQQQADVSTGQQQTEVSTDQPQTDTTTGQQQTELGSISEQDDNDEPDTSSDEELTTRSTTRTPQYPYPLLLGGELKKVVEESGWHCPNKDDMCAVCLCSWDEELVNAFVTLLPKCHHALCLRCLNQQGARTSTDASNSNMVLNCPLCRELVDDLDFRRIAETVLELSPVLMESANELPLSPLEIKDAVCALILSNDFCLSDVADTIETMMEGSTSAFAENQDLSPSDKQLIYEEANRPVRVIENQLREAQRELELFYDFRSPEYVECFNRINQLRRTLTSTRVDARLNIFERMNAPGGMGVLQQGGEKMTLDFHALTAKGASKQFEDMVRPVLPVLKTVILIVGQGRNSTSGTSVLRSVMINYITGKHDEFVGCRDVEGNPGRLEVYWKL